MLSHQSKMQDTSCHSICEKPETLGSILTTTYISLQNHSMRSSILIGFMLCVHRRTSWLQFNKREYLLQKVHIKTQKLRNKTNKKMHNVQEKAVDKINLVTDESILFLPHINNFHRNWSGLFAPRHRLSSPVARKKRRTLSKPRAYEKHG